MREYPERISIKGNLKFTSRADNGTKIVRELLPAVNQSAFIEAVTVYNTSGGVQKYTVCSKNYSKKTSAFWCIGGEIITECAVVFGDTFKQEKSSNREFVIAQNESFTFYCVYYAYQKVMPSPFSIKKEIEERKAFVDEMFTSLKLTTPFPEMDAQFSHCILRGSESIFKTKNGLMHSPGGGNYYAALWTNDQCEYANPFFRFQATVQVLSRV